MLHGGIGVGVMRYVRKLASVPTLFVCLWRDLVCTL